MFVQVKDYFAVLFCLEQKSPFLKKTKICYRQTQYLLSEKE